MVLNEVKTLSEKVDRVERQIAALRSKLEDTQCCHCQRGSRHVEHRQEAQEIPVSDRQSPSFLPIAGTLFYCYKIRL